MNQLNLPEFKVIEIHENDNDLLFSVEAIEPPLCCPGCGSVAYYKHGKTERFARDLSMYGKRVGINIIGHRYRCRDCNTAFSEKYSSIDERDKITYRLRDYIKAQSLKRPFANIADEFSISPTSVKRIFDEYVSENEPFMVFKSPRVLGIDEVHLNKQMRAVFTDIDELMILEMLPDRNKQTIIKFLDKIRNKEQIQIVTTDMWQPYKDAVKQVLPNAQQVVDKFHVIQYGTKAMEDARKIVRKQVTDKDRKKLMHERFILLKNKEDLTEVERFKLIVWFGDFPDLEVAYKLKEGLRDMYLCKSKEEAIGYFNSWKEAIPDKFKAFQDVAKMIDNWHIEIFNYFDYKVTNAFTESINNLIKHIEKLGRGYSFEVLRAKVMFSTRATKKPKYGEEDFTKMSMTFTFRLPPLENGFGVSIPQLLNAIKRDDF